MTRVFLSCAAEDDAIAVLVRARLEEAGVDVSWWQTKGEPNPRSGDLVERGIESASAFLILMSPHYLTSSRCRHERDVALQYELDLARRFVYVMEVAATPYSASGPLRRNDWLDGTGTDRNTLLEGLAGELRAHNPAHVPELPHVSVFRDRLQERLLIVNSLATASGPSCWVVVAPPRMGKSWLLDRVQQDLTERDGRWSTRLLDVRDCQVELRASVAAIVGALFDVDAIGDDATRSETGCVASSPAPLSDTVLYRIRAAIEGRRHPQLFVLDSAELLLPACARATRTTLAKLYHSVADTQIGLLVGTRSHAEWRGIGVESRYGLRFAPVPLSEFRHDVLEEALEDLDIGIHGDWLRRYAARLYELSQGLPALLIRCLRWAVRTEFSRMDQADDDVFDEVARDYVRNDLLTSECLLPHGAERPRQALAAMGLALRSLSVYRLFTMSHLRYHAETDADLAATLRAADWTEADLWGSLNDAAVCAPATDDLWQVIEPSIRRLLNRYYHRTAEERLHAHVIARKFYEGWTNVRTAGKEQPVVLVECLWHEASRMMIEQPSDLPVRLPEIASNLTREFTALTAYARDGMNVSPTSWGQDFTAALIVRLRDDEEFHELLAPYDGLFESVVESVRVIGQRA